MYSKTITIPLKSILAVREFTHIAETSKCHIEVSDGFSTVNGASIVGVMNLDLNKKLSINITADEILEIETTAEEIKRLSVVSEDSGENGF